MHIVIETAQALLYVALYFSHYSILLLDPPCNNLPKVLQIEEDRLV